MDDAADSSVPARLQGRVNLRPGGANAGGGSRFGQHDDRDTSSAPKGRGNNDDNAAYRQRYGGRSGQFDSIRAAPGESVQKSKEGYILIVTGLHEETQEDHILDVFQEFGDLVNMHLNLDRRTGYVKGYAFVEFTGLDEAQNARAKLNGTKLLDTEITVDFAFKQAPARGGRQVPRRMSPLGRRGREADVMDDADDGTRARKR
eukprot:c8307_g1_i1.p1 GENE.c8307_g1_i1~~c8307_g1_i1.p1  ORF type:complete len:219 (+),score=44.95 c8307_g1_i1:50-658(+)